VRGAQAHNERPSRSPCLRIRGRERSRFRTRRQAIRLADFAFARMEREQRLECLEKLSRSIAPPARPAPAGDNTSRRPRTNTRQLCTPDGSTATSRPLAAAQMAPRCSSRFCAMCDVSGPAISRSGADYAISYRINDAPPVQACGRRAIVCTGAAVHMAMWRAMLNPSPKRAKSLSVSPDRCGPRRDFCSAGLKDGERQVAAHSKWPQAVARPRN